jgi:hypothetical protein
MDEHRCRVWWELHKHHLRVGDAAVRFIKQSVPHAPQQLGNCAFPLLLHAATHAWRKRARHPLPHAWRTLHAW